MSNSTVPEQRGTGRETPTAPRAVIHKKILDAAAADPTATMAEIADEVSGASTDLVERVLDEYGDPAGDDAGETTDDSTDGPETGQANAERAPAMTAEQTGDTRSPEALDERERAVLSAVADRPNATQAEIADELGVSRATVSRRVSDIEGLEWSDRAEFVGDRFDDQAGNSNGGDEDAAAAETSPEEETSNRGPHANGATGSDEIRSNGAAGGDETPPGTSSDGTRNGHGAETAAADDETTGDATGGRSTGDRDGALADRVAALEERLDGLAAGRERPDDQLDPELVHKVVDACMASDRISQDEEVRVLSAVLGRDGQE